MRESWQHGTDTGYRNHGCRCDACRQAAMAYEKQRVIGICARCGGPTNSRYRTLHCKACHVALLAPDHGSESRYGTGCRCELCRKAAAEGRRKRRHKHDAVLEHIPE